jgi:hypothetical protein
MSPLLLGRCSRQLRKSCAFANMVYSRAERVFILEHYFSKKSFAAVCEVFINAYHDKEVPNKTQYTDWKQNFGTQEAFAYDKCSTIDKTA